MTDINPEARRKQIPVQRNLLCCVKNQKCKVEFSADTCHTCITVFVLIKVHVQYMRDLSTGTQVHKYLEVKGEFHMKFFKDMQIRLRTQPPTADYFQIISR